jgi:three-Cys-motif partner protein
MDASPGPVDEIGPWSEIKLDIVREYAQAYSTVLARQPRLQHVYVDAFAGAGLHRSEQTGQLVDGSPLVALAVTPRFYEYHFIDLNPSKTAALLRRVERSPTVHVHTGDCNRVLMDEVLPRCRWDDYRRALWLLDPNGLHYKWSVVQAAARACSIELFLNFPIMDINRTVGRRDPAGVSQAMRHRMTEFWGDTSWERIVHSAEDSLFEEFSHKATGGKIVDAYRTRLKEIAGFAYAPKPLLLTVPRTNAPLYYIVFASHKATGNRIATHILKKYHRLLRGS